MTHKQIVNAYIALVRLGGAQLPVKTAHALYLLRKKLEPAYQFCAEQEQLIVERCNGTATNGTITFADEKSVRQAQTALQELYDLEVDLGLEVVMVRIDDIKDCTLSVNDMEALEGFIALA